MSVGHGIGSIIARAAALAVITTVWGLVEWTAQTVAAAESATATIRSPSVVRRRLPEV